MKSSRSHLHACLWSLLLCVSATAQKPLQVFVLAGDENVLEQGIATGPDKPGTMEAVLASQPKYAFLRDSQGRWASRDDVLLYDSHPLHNNTRAEAGPVAIVTDGLGGSDKALVTGVTATLSHRLGEAIDAPVLIIRHGTKHPIWFYRGSRDLSHDYRPPSSGGGADHDGSWDVIHFNHGIHDTGHRDPKAYKSHDETKFPCTIPLDEYEANLRRIVAKMKNTRATLIWARTTPVMDETPGWVASDIDAYNAVADKVMKENGVILNDLHAESIRQGFPKKPDVHSVGKFAPKVSEVIEQAIAARRTRTKPLPRVLMIGDSITGTYWQEVEKNLDGKAYVCKNPANGGHSRYGLESIDEWLRIDNYLLNGQEYLQLVSGVRDALDDLGHSCPQHAARGAELAGLIWIQGEKDALWKSKAEAYEGHLANLIRDLRRDWKRPDLPVVVTAIANGKRPMPLLEQQVFDAQMAVGDPRKYPEFAGNVTTIDTRPMCRPPEQSPGGRDRFAGNAGSYLEIGETMAEAILKLQPKPAK
jgi:lysophospholipase L1-like esterase